jgi:hypothetical protein
MLRVLVFALVVATSAVSYGQYAPDGSITIDTDPNGSEAYRTTQDPGWWQRTFVGWDQNGDGQYTGGERGVLVMAWDGVMSLLWNITKPLLDRLLTLIPSAKFTAAVGYFAAVVYYFKIANAWVPLDYASGLLVAYYTFLSGYFTVRVTVKLIRGA